MGAPRYVEKLTPVERALEITFSRVKPVKDVHRLPVLNAVGMALASDVEAPHDFPPKPRSAYDGYAVRSDDTPGRLKVVGEATIGSVNVKLKVERGTAAYVSTGAYLPDGADAVVPEEEVRLEGDYIVIERKVEKWENVDPVGFYVKKGTRLLSRGTVLTMMDAAALLDVGVTVVEVYRRVRLALLITGNELFEPDGAEDLERILRGEVAETTGKLVQWFISRYVPWSEVTVRLILPDNVDVIAWYVERQLRNVDVIIMTGGTGPSTVDTFYQLAETIRGELLFRGLRVRGGRPTSALLLTDGRLLVALSGHPISALHALLRYLYPVLKYVGNVTKAAEPPIHCHAELLSGYRSRRPEPLKAKLCIHDGKLYATPLPRERQLSSVIVSNVEADGILLSEGREHRKGELLPVMLYREPGRCQD